VVIELLKVKIPPKLREKFIQKDAEIWTAALAKYPGFMGS
jgi:antibiotic biosynthesis monooxygenase (ABM) superfamily enzyme